jgi:nucleoside-diphosphate-sugar epimerase
MRRRVPSISKIRDMVGWQPTISLAQTLDEVAADLKSNKNPQRGET